MGWEEALGKPTLLHMPSKPGASLREGKEKQTLKGDFNPDSTPPLHLSGLPPESAEHFSFLVSVLRNSNGGKMSVNRQMPEAGVQGGLSFSRLHVIPTLLQSCGLCQAALGPSLSPCLTPTPFQALQLPALLCSPCSHLCLLATQPPAPQPLNTDASGSWAIPRLQLEALGMSPSLPFAAQMTARSSLLLFNSWLPPDWLR